MQCTPTGNRSSWPRKGFAGIVGKPRALGGTRLVQSVANNGRNPNNGKEEKPMNHLDKKIVLEKLTPAQRRVVIAKDVIAALDAKKINAQPGIYCEIDLAFEEVVGKDLRSKIPDAKQCNVCALGAIFVAKVARFNDFNVGKENYGSFVGDDTEIVDVGGGDIRSNLSEYFDDIQLGLIESAFEKITDFAYSAFYDRSKSGRVTPEENRLCDRAACFSRSNNPEFRMRKIMQNIIDNHGTFKP